ncbi:ACP phosphodiesterase [Alteromonas confluentis]|uniref:ACP phosphodiesterase n=1 Tax=Alteromonas confluentis TaxID=1656094 RepID=A0A1E7ZAU9_9ALTE|nr:ACP phosphodiesterase [Alteromonas confluentis]OFC70571.1 ACP phosphodiesterase [Alteromonas confluentis]
MNYLAHLFLAQPTADSCYGNLLGDFQKGIDVTQLPQAVKNGLENHKLVDKFTDSHPWVTGLRQTFSPQRRRFAGITLDVLFDHFLIQHWQQFSHQPFQTFCDNRYALLAKRHNDMPPCMHQVVGSMLENRWLDVYENVEGVAMALDRTASRIRFRHRFEGSIEEILPAYTQINKEFPAFFSELEAHIKEKGLEAPSA